MKIVYTLPSTAKVGGLERIVLAKANWLANNGYEIIIVTINQNGQPPIYAIDSRIKCIDLGLNFLWDSKNILRKALSRPKMTREYKKRLQEILLQEQPDITIMTGNDVGYDIKEGSKKISEFHNARGYLFVGRNKSIIKYIVNLYLMWRKKYHSKKFDAFVCLTQEDKEDWGKDMKNIHVIPNFIKHDYPLSSLQNKQAIAVGRLVQIKRFDLLISAWKYVYKVYPDWTLKIYGDGPLKEELQRIIVEKGLQDVVSLCGNTNEIMRKYAESSVIVSTSASEGFHMGLLEAMTCGVPVVSFDCKCGPKELVCNGESGFLVQHGNVKELAERIMQIIGDEELRKKMGRSAYKMSWRYDETVVMQKWENLFNEVCER